MGERKERKYRQRSRRRETSFCTWAGATLGWPRKSFEFNPGYDKWQTSSTSRIGRRLTALCTADRYSYNETERLMDLKHEFLRLVFREWNIPFRLRKTPANRHFNTIREQLCVELIFCNRNGYKIRRNVSPFLLYHVHNTRICSRGLPYAKQLAISCLITECNRRANPFTQTWLVVPAESSPPCQNFLT